MSVSEWVSEWVTLSNSWVKIPTVDFTDVTLAIGDTYGDNGKVFQMA